MKKTLLICLGLAAQCAQAAVLTNVPMQGPMLHVSLRYEATNNRLGATVDPTVPQVTPLDVSNPGDSFSPADPWYPYLDPGQMGLAFNRQYGIVVDAATDPLPADTGIWIRMLSASPGLATYRYRSTDPKAWEPIFGTAGSTNLWQWNLMMFHPSVAVEPANGTHTATFEAFAVRLSTGQPIAGVGTAPFTLNWTVVPSARPALSVDQRIVIKWSAAATNYLLQCADSVPSTNWVAVTNAPVLIDGQNAVVLDKAATHQFFRLNRAP